MVELIDEFNRPRQLTGKIFWISPPKDKRIDINKLNMLLGGHSWSDETVNEKINEEIDKGAIVPDVFKSDGKIKPTTNIHAIHTIENKFLYGYVIMDELQWINYKEKKILIMRTKNTSFVIFEYEVNKRYYLLIFGSRLLCDDLASVLSKKLTAVAINHCELDQSGLNEIREELNADLLDTTLTDFADKRIKKKRIWGEGYQETSDYKKDSNKSNVTRHMMKADIFDNEAVFSLSEDALVRFYTAKSPSDYIKFLEFYVLKCLVHTSKDSPNSSVIGYTTDEIFEDDEEN
jgi:hypothetical protein